MLNPADAGVFKHLWLDAIQANAPDGLVYSVDLGNQGALDVCDLGAMAGSRVAAIGRRGTASTFASFSMSCCTD
jgi:hypothetical protein